MGTRVTKKLPKTSPKVVNFYMIDSEEEKRILRLAYIPEHIVTLMRHISKGEPFLNENYLFFIRDHGLIFIGYPLEGDFSEDALFSKLEETLRIFDPQYVRLIAPKVPQSLKKKAAEFINDYYYTLNLGCFHLPQRLKKQIEKHSPSLQISKDRAFTSEHEKLINSFIKFKRPHYLVEALYRSIKEWISASPSALLLNARNNEGELCAFYVLEFGAERFLSYLLGCRSENLNFPHASDLLFLEMVKIAKDQGKLEINLGLGVNEGIKRFKEKWGGRPSIPYEFAEIRRKVGLKGFLMTIDSILSRI